MAAGAIIWSIITGKQRGFAPDLSSDSIIQHEAALPSISSFVAAGRSIYDETEASIVENQTV
jgi:hypothetical protein